MAAPVHPYLELMSQWHHPIRTRSAGCAPLALLSTSQPVLAEMCSASRPADYQPPLDYEYDDSEKELIRKLDEDEDTMRRVRDQAGVLLPVCACTCM